MVDGFLGAVGAMLLLTYTCWPGTHVRGRPPTSGVGMRSFNKALLTDVPSKVVTVESVSPELFWPLVIALKVYSINAWTTYLRIYATWKKRTMGTSPD